MDHHRFYPYGMLWSNVSLGEGSRYLLSGGHTPWGQLSASFTTFWNVSSSSGPLAQGPPGWDTGYKINFVGMPFADSVKTFETRNAVWLDWYREDVPLGKDIVPGELYSAMVAARLARLAAREVAEAAADAADAAENAAEAAAAERAARREEQAAQAAALAEAMEAALAGMQG
eukprot:350576-Chlamydomonas_euryale.AAC.13